MSLTQSQNPTEFPSLNSLLAWAGVHEYKQVKVKGKRKHLTELILVVWKDDLCYFFKRDGDKFMLIATSSKDVMEDK